MCCPVGMGVNVGRVVVHRSFMYVCMTFLCGTAKQVAYFMRCKIGYHFLARLKFVCHARNGVGVHDAFHHFLVNGQRHIYFRTLITAGQC